MHRLSRWTAPAAGVVLLAVCTRTAADPDLWGHLRFGLDTLRAHALTAVDPYSFTQDRPWINHEWLSEVQMALAYRAAGVAGLALLKGVLVFAALWLAWSALRGTDFVVRMLAMGVLVLATGSVTPTLRPQLWSLLAMALVGTALRTDERRWRVALPLLFAAWANVHGGWVVGFGTLGAWAAADVIVTGRLAEWALVVAASALATLATPYGTPLWRFLFDTVHMTRDITEWQPLFRMPLMNWLPIVAIAAAAAWLLPGVRRQRLPLTASLLILAFGAWRVSRIGPLFAMAAVTMLGPDIARRWPQRPIADLLAPRAAMLAAGALSAAAIAAAGWIGAGSLSCIGVAGSWAAPASLINALSAAPAGRVVTTFDWGQYALWHLGPRIRVSMDGRRETIYTDARLAEHDAVVRGTPAGLRTLADWHVEYVLLPQTTSSTRTWLTSHDYRLAIDAPGAFLAVRADVPAWDLPAASVTRRCFPE